MKKAYKSQVNFSFLTTIIIIAIIIAFPSVRNLYSATKDTYRVIENKFRIFNQIIQYVNEYYYDEVDICLLYTSPSPRDGLLSRMPSSA